MSKEIKQLLVSLSRDVLDSFVHEQVERALWVNTLCNCHVINSLLICGMAQKAKKLATKPKDLSTIPRTHMVGKDKKKHSVLTFYKHHRMCIDSHRHTYKQTTHTRMHVCTHAYKM